MKNEIYLYFVVLIISALLNVSSSYCLGKEDLNLLDGYLCEENLKILIVGDSVVKGDGDQSLHGGGYVSRLSKALPCATVKRIYIDGGSTKQILTLLQSGFRKGYSSAIVRLAIDSDFVVIDAGRNDFWKSQSPISTVATLKKMADTLKSGITKYSDTSPYVTIARLLPCTRYKVANGSWVSHINSINARLAGLNQRHYHTDLHFEKLSKKFLSKDGLHPSSRGYTVLSNMIISYIQKKIKTLQLLMPPSVHIP